MSILKNISNRFVFYKFRTNRNSKKKNFFFTKSRIEKIDENKNEKINVDNNVNNVNN